MMQYVVQAKYSGFYGWEDVTAADDLPDAERLLNEYNENEATIPHRIVRKWVAR